MSGRSQAEPDIESRINKDGSLTMTMSREDKSQLADRKAEEDAAHATRVITDPAEASRLGVKVGDHAPVSKTAHAEEDKASAAPVNKWKCHKVVTARKILAIDPITTEDEKGNKQIVDMPPTAFTDGRPSAGDYVLLDDAASVTWKTAKEFERDYSPWDGKKTDRVITDPAEAKRLGVKVGDPDPAERHRRA